MFSDKVLGILKSSGWKPCRKVDTNKFVKILEAEGYTVYNSVLIFLESFGNLRIVFPSLFKDENFDTITFNIEKAVKEISHDWILEEYSERVGTKLCLIGQGFSNHMSLSMDINGKVYGGYDDFLVLIGNSGNEAIELLCTRKKFTEID